MNHVVVGGHFEKQNSPHKTPIKFEWVRELTDIQPPYSVFLVCEARLITSNLEEK